MRFDFREDAAIHRYLTNLYESIVNRDILKKSKGMDKKTFLDISLYILANAGKEFSVDNIIEYYRKTIIRKYPAGQSTIIHHPDKYDSFRRHGIAHMNIIDFLLYKKELALT